MRYKLAMQNFILAGLLLLSTLTTQAADISHFGLDNSQTRASFAEKFRLMVWNVHKYDDPQLTIDYQKYGKEAELILFQEAIDRQDFASQLMRVSPEVSWSMAKAFYWDSSDANTGVATGAKIRVQTERALLSEVTEPILSTPKTILISEFKIANSSKTLLVCNMHAINFVMQSTYEEHVDQMIQAIRQHHGPMIVAGDFNTWSFSRYDYLETELKKIGIKHLQLDDSGSLPLDHVFVRDIELLQSIHLPELDSSDHQPILIDLKFAKGSLK